MFCKQFSYKIEEENDNDPGHYGATISIFVFYLNKGDLAILTNGYDNRGNICGRNNIKTNSIPFEGFGKNMEQKKFLFTKYIFNGTEYEYSQTCVEDCEILNAKVIILNRCYVEGMIPFIGFLLEILVVCKYIIIILLFSIFVSIVMLTLYIICTNFMVKFSILYLGVVLIGSAIYCWINRIRIMEFDTALPAEFHYETNFLIFGTCIFVLTLILFCFSNYLKSKLKLSMLILHVAAKAINAMPALLLLPLATSLMLCLCSFIYFYTVIFVFSYCYCSEIHDFHLKQNFVLYLPFDVISPICYITISFFWLIEVILSAQYMIVSGCVAQWFYTRNKDDLFKPIKKNILKLFRYYLGTICTGSILLVIINLIKQILGLFKSSGTKKESIVSCFCNFMTETFINSAMAFLTFFSHNGYIMTAIYGYPFCRGSIHAVKLQYHNIFNVIVINKVGDFVLLSAKLCIALTSALLGGMVIYIFKGNLFNKSIILFVIGLNSYFIADTFFAVFEAAIDTIFLCFCEDCKYNDGTSRPYYMPSDLVKYVENANNFVDPIKWRIVAEFWENGPKRAMVV